MANWKQFDDEAGTWAGEQSAACQVCETVLPDAVDGLLSEAEQRAFDRHVAGCAVCSRELEEAQRGAAWLDMLKQQPPEPAPTLLERILAQTSGAEGSTPVTVSDALHPTVPADAPVPNAAPVFPRVPALRPSVWTRLTGAFSLDWMRPMLQPRLVMTAAMAFFSIAVTLNLTGVRLQDLRAGSFTPAGLRRAVADRSASAVRSFQNMRVVYQAEAQVHDLRESWQGERPETAAPDSPADAPHSRANGKRSGSEEQSPGQPRGSSRLDLAAPPAQDNGTEQKGA